MGTWGTSLFSDDMALDIKHEYGILLSVGKTNEEVEKLLIDYYSEILNCDDPDEDVFWFTLAICEWKRGRLSSFVKENALKALENGRDLERWKASGNEKQYKERVKVLEKLKQTILSPMPLAKTISKPRVRHCPWEVGSLLAYRIVSNCDLIINHPCYKKYVLLRVLKIDRRPITNRFITEYYNENMLVGLYDWIGSEIPDPNIVNNLNYIHMEKGGVQKPAERIDWSLLEALPQESAERIRETLTEFFYDESAEKCVWFDWRSGRDEKVDITLLGCDKDFQNNFPDFYKPEPRSRTYVHNISLDMKLKTLFESKVAEDEVETVLTKDSAPCGNR